MRYKNLLDMIGDTPVIELTRLSPTPQVKIYAKLEGCNPTGSLKDRVAKYMVEAAEREGRLDANTVLLEPTSGNTGISLGMIAKLKGYRVVAVMPETMSVERRELMQAYGVEIVLSKGEEGTNGAIRLAHDMVQRDRRYLMLDQYSNPNNPLAHYETTAAEILRDIPDPLDVFIAGLGTGGTLMGAGQRLKEVYPRLQIIAVQPYPKGGLQGLRSLMDGYVPPILDLTRLDRNEVVRDVDAFTMVKALVEQEGLFMGISSGAVIWQAVEVARRMEKGTIMTILPDGGWKYISERLWSKDVQTIAAQYDGPLW